MLAVFTTLIAVAMWGTIIYYAFIAPDDGSDPDEQEKLYPN